MGAGASVDEGVTVDGELAKVLSASDGDLAAAADKLNRDIKRMVPKTASGRLDAASIKEDERESVLEILGRARRLAEHGYAAVDVLCHDGDGALHVVEALELMPFVPDFTDHFRETIPKNPTRSMMSFRPVSPNNGRAP